MTGPRDFVRRGLRRIARARPPRSPKGATFDPDFYRRTNADLTHFTDEEARVHWIDFGRREGRIPSLEESWRVLGRRRRRRRAGRHVGALNNVDLGALVIANPSAVRAGALTMWGTFSWLVTKAKKPELAKSVTLPNEYLESLARHSSRGADSWSYATDDVSEMLPRSSTNEALNGCPADHFVIESYRFFVGIVPSARDLHEWLGRLDSGEFWRPSLLALLIESGPFGSSEVPIDLTATEAAQAGLGQAMEYLRSRPAPEVISLMGIPVMPVARWREKASSLEVPQDQGSRASTENRRSSNKRMGQPRASVLVSLYRSAEFLPAWIRNVEETLDFDSFEFILMSVDPTSNERALLTEFAERNTNVILREYEAPFGIYEAWNAGLELASSHLVTNMNVDDIRAPHSLVTQARILEENEWIDVVYQDVRMTLRSDLSWEDLEAIDAQCQIPIATLAGFMSGLNPPHNGPMWRRALHDEVGVFETKYRSASDFDFWIRCARQGKVFFNVPDPHVGYFENPDGLSTSGVGLGLREGRAVLDEQRSNLLVDHAPDYADHPEIGLPVSRARRLDAGFVDEMIRTRLAWERR